MGIRNAYRLATSVATRTRLPPLLNFARAPRRELWLSWPCNGTAGKPSVLRIIDNLRRFSTAEIQEEKERTVVHHVLSW